MDVYAAAILRFFRPRTKSFSNHIKMSWLRSLRFCRGFGSFCWTWQPTTWTRWTIPSSWSEIRAMFLWVDDDSFPWTFATKPLCDIKRRHALRKESVDFNLVWICVFAMFPRLVWLDFAFAESIVGYAEWTLDVWPKECARNDWLPTESCISGRNLEPTGNTRQCCRTDVGTRPFSCILKGGIPDFFPRLYFELFGGC